MSSMYDDNALSHCPSTSLAPFKPQSPKPEAISRTHAPNTGSLLEHVSNRLEVIATSEDNATMARVCATYIKRTFSCPDTVLITTESGEPEEKLLVELIDSTLACCRIKQWHPIAFIALFYLHKLKARHSASQGRDGFRLFIAAFIAASGPAHPVRYDTWLWAQIGQFAYSVETLEHMLAEMRHLISVEVPRIDINELSIFVNGIRSQRM